jgi:hypothetical protein
MEENNTKRIQEKLYSKTTIGLATMTDKTIVPLSFPVMCPFCEDKYRSYRSVKDHIKYQHIDRDHWARWVFGEDPKWVNIP